MVLCYGRAQARTWRVHRTRISLRTYPSGLLLENEGVRLDYGRQAQPPARLQPSWLRIRTPVLRTTRWAPRLNYHRHERPSRSNLSSLAGPNPFRIADGILRIRLHPDLRKRRSTKAPIQ